MLWWMLPLAVNVDEVALYIGDEITLSDPAGWSQTGVLVGFTQTDAVLRKPDGAEQRVPLAAYATVRPVASASHAPSLPIEALTPTRFLLDGRPVGWERASYALSSDPEAAQWVVKADRQTSAGGAMLGLGAALLVSGLITGATEECLYYPGMMPYCYHRWNIGGPLVAAGVVVGGAGSGLRLHGLHQRVRAVEAQQE